MNAGSPYLPIAKPFRKPLAAKMRRNPRASMRPTFPSVMK